MQKFELLHPLKKYLNENLSPNTARTYYSAVVKLFQDKSFLSFSEINEEMVKQEAHRFRTKNEFSALKNGLKHLANCYPEISLPSADFFTDISLKKRNFTKRPKKVIYEHPTQRKINQIQNIKLKFAYRLAIISGLRVSELADLEASDIKIEKDKIYVTVQNGKGGHGGIIECRQDKYLYEKLPQFIEENSEGKLFYSEVYMREQADRLGFECHDLRRIFAIRTRNELKKEMSVEDANAVVQKELRHVRFSTTKRYLFNRKLKIEYEKQKTQQIMGEEKAASTTREVQNGI